MDSWQRRVLLENIIYKTFRKKKLDDREKKLVEEIIEIRDYGRVLE